MINLKKDLHAAKTVALRYLSRAPRSIKEVELKLKEKGITGDALKETIGYLIDRSYLNDDLFAKNWVNSKTKTQLWGQQRIREGLKQKGIHDEIIKRAIDTLGGETTELDRAESALKKWLRTKAKYIQGPQKNKATTQKALRHLQAKGFSISVIIAAIKKYYGESATYEGQ